MEERLVCFLILLYNNILIHKHRDQYGIKNFKLRAE